ncbi:MAG TPA: EamA family transporter [Acidovorax sp.]|nr:EamA family transporter [Acidovorax sp.]
MTVPTPSARPVTRLHAALAGIALAVTACAFFALLDTASKLVSVGVPIVMALWMRYVFQSLLTTAFVLQRAGRSALRTTQPRFQALRGALFAMTSLFGFISLTALPLAEFTAIVATVPLCVTVVAALWLHQPKEPVQALLGVAQVPCRDGMQGAVRSG